ncbi:MAG: thiamine pyrophosphate-binding protein [Actinobacteria bacterium]|nr:thiamine pyrophosphate-binding protein [Actinomycetota bacterium]
MITVADYITSYVSDTLGVQDVFLVTGGGIMFLTDSLARNEKLRKVCTHHEQAAAMALEAYSRSTGKLGVGYFTTGPGATNALTGLVGAWQDSVPCLFVAGQVKRKETVRLSGIAGLRQYGVQEVDILPIVESVTKYAVMLDDPLRVRFELEKAVAIATGGRPGPVWIDVPLDVQGALIDPTVLEAWDGSGAEPARPALPAPQIEEFKRLFAQAKRPIVLAGQGVRLAGALGQLREWVEATGVPVVTTHPAVDTLEYDHPNLVGCVGIKGTRAGNLAMQNSDLLIAIGTSLHVAVIGYEYELFARVAKKVVVDIDETSHRKKTIEVDLFVNADAGEFLAEVADSRHAGNGSWAETCRNWKAEFPVCLPEYGTAEGPSNIYWFVERLSQLMDATDTVVADAGSAYYAVSQGLRLKRDQRYVVSGALATMGYTLPACAGVSAATGARTVGVTGDGSLQFNIQELQTLVTNNLPVKLFVLNNNGYLSIRQTQDRFFEGRYLGEGPRSGVSCPDLELIARAYGIPFFRSQNPSDLDAAILSTLATGGPAVCEVMTPQLQEIIPTVASVKREDGSMVSRPLEDMYPFLERSHLQRIMVVPPVEDRDY